jgi:hypothetical protein
MNDVNKFLLKNFFDAQVAIKDSSSLTKEQKKEILFEMQNANIFELDFFSDQILSLACLILREFQIEPGKYDFKSEAEILDQDINLKKEYKQLISNFKLENLELPSPYTYIGNPKKDDAPTKDMENFCGLLITKKYFLQIITVKQNNKEVISIAPVVGDIVPLQNFNSEDLLMTSQMLINHITYLQIINTFQKINIDLRTKKSQFDMNWIMKKKKVEKPKAYYRVQLHSGTSILEDKELEDKFRIVREKTFAYFVRAHYKVRIIKGSLPLSEREEKFLRKDSRRRIFTSKDQVDSESWEILQRRQVQWNDNEWISILEYRVCGHIANSKDGKNPYIPSIHVVPAK